MHRPRSTREDVSLTGLLPLEALEVCSGMVFGRRRAPATRADAPSDGSGPRKVLEELLLPALERSPCLVAFSGGRDSSALLALASRLARNHGLDDPVPVTLRFAQHPRTDETDWQETTVRHLRLDRWEVLSLTTELEVLGPIAGPAVRRHGLYWPPNAHTLVPLLRAARGGVLVTGNGGDEVFSPWIWRRAPISRIVRAHPRRAVRYATFALLPASLQVRLWCRRTLGLPWLRPAARQEVYRLYLAKYRRRSPTWGDALENLLDTRHFELTQGIFAALAEEADAGLSQPFFDPRFLRAVAQAAPRGFPTRSAAMEAHFGDLLPQRVVERSTKARFTDVLWGPDSRAFAERWDGTGLDPALVDPNALRLEWSKPRPDFRSLTPLQAAWLASESQD
ncbi:MAG TPA: asparagine synthase-related protein [Gemmatimonadota bacterium]|nr:asparagine synthase-related protein [Gemmatimonadota bacterium]